MTAATDDVQQVRRLAPEVLGALVRRYGHFDESEDAVQEALVAAAVQWPVEGRPTSPKAWLLTVAARRLANRLRSDDARRRREQTEAVPPPDGASGPGTVGRRHPDAAVSLLSPGVVAIGAGRPHAAGSRRSDHRRDRPRLPRAGSDDGAAHQLGPSNESGTAAPRSGCPRTRSAPSGSASYSKCLYLLFNEGYTAMAGPDLTRPDLTAEAVRLARDLLRLVPDDGEVAGLLALMLLVDARRPARTGPDGALVPLAEQDRTRWDRSAIAEGVALVTASLAGKPLGPYQLQAAIAAVHDEAPTVEDTDWPQILELYRLLERMVPGPTVTLNRAVAEAMVHGPRAGLDLLDTLTVDNRVSGAHRFDAVRAHLLEMAGEHREAHATYQRAARRTASIPERRYLLTRARSLVLDRPR